MNGRWEWIILSVTSLNVFEENIVVTVFAKLVPLFSNVLALLFLARSLIDRCQIAVKIMFQSLFGSLLDHLYPYANENVSVRHLSLSCITSNFSVLCLPTCPSSPTPSPMPSPTPAGIKHLFYHSISLYRWRSVLSDVGINSMVLLLIV